jgi:predicted permease
MRGLSPGTVLRVGFAVLLAATLADAQGAASDVGPIAGCYAVELGAWSDPFPSGSPASHQPPSLIRLDTARLAGRSGHPSDQYRVEPSFTVPGSQRVSIGRWVIVGDSARVSWSNGFSAGVLVASLQAVRGIDAGFHADGVMTASVVLPVERYPDNPAVANAAERQLASMRAAPGLTAVGGTFAIPFGGTREATVVAPEDFQPRADASFVVPLLTTATPGYFDAMGIPVVSGRAFDNRDQSDAPQVAIVDRRLADLFWPGQDPVGKRVYFPQSTSEPGITGTTQLYTVIGVVADVAITGLTPHDPLVGTIYFPVAQRPTRALVFAARSSLGTAAASREMRSAVAAVDPAIPVFDERLMTERLDNSLIARRVPMTLAALFGGIATALAAVGIFGMLAYRVTHRRRETSIRVALGSTPSRIVTMMLWDTVRVVVPGLAAGCVLVAALSPVLRSMLFGVHPMEPSVLALAAALLIACALAAALVPALRASRADPATALGE